MTFLKHICVAGATVLYTSAAALAGSWTLDGDTSKLAFGSIKKDTIGEVHSFQSLKGAVAADGSVKIEIDLSSVETNIDIRNERMIEHVFNKAPSAELTAQIDLAAMEKLVPGETSIVDVEGQLSFLGATVDVDTEMFVARLSDSKVMVSTNDMIFLSTEDAGITAGVDKLMELAKLPGITRTSPVTMRLVFNAGTEEAAVPAAAEPEVQVAEVTGDAKAGKKVFRKCRACHMDKEGKNGVGPSLYKIVGAEAAQVDGYKYSNAMKESAITWTVDELTAFLSNPKKHVPGTKMGFPGLKKDADIENVIAYLQKTAK